MATTTARVTTTPRPSISPLSTASKHTKSSPIATRERAMLETGISEASELDNAVDAMGAEVGEQADDRSSSLSEPEDDNGDEEEQNGIDEDIVDGEQAAAHTSLEVDSEAETERLDHTPQKLRKDASSLSKTPSKLSRTAAIADEELSDPPSPLPMGAGAASSTGTVTTAGQKRKRSDTADSSLTSADSEPAGSPRKRSDGSARDLKIGGDEAITSISKTTEVANEANDPPVIDASRETSAIPVKSVRGRKGKLAATRGKKQKDQMEELGLEASEENGAGEDVSEENAVNTEAELKAKKEASTLYDDVTKQFRAFKDKLYDERLATITAELQLLSQPNCQHPEYLRQVACVDARQQKQVSEAHAYYNYKLRSIRERTLGERSQLHSQYFQTVRELREEALYKLGEEWYALQKDRRHIHQEKDDQYVYKYQPKRSIQIKQQAKYNQEVSVLSGVAKYVGFPAAPDINGAEDGDVNDDFKAMKISKRVHQTSSAYATISRPVYVPNPAATTSIEQSERLAHERFIEQHAWARPQAPIIHGNPIGSTPGISHTPDWAEPSSGSKHLVRNFSSGSGVPQPRNASPFVTPAPQKRIPMERSSSGTVLMNSDGAEPEIPSSVLAAPPTSERMGSLLNQNHSSSQPSPLNVQKTRENGIPALGGQRELTGFRNISNISGASTIDAPLPDNLGPTAERAPSDNALRSTELSTPAPPAPSGLPPGPSTSITHHQPFDTSMLNRPDSERRDVFPNTTGFRAAEGAFGTPAPLQQQPAPPAVAPSGS